MRGLAHILTVLLCANSLMCVSSCTCPLSEKEQCGSGDVGVYATVVRKDNCIDKETVYYDVEIHGSVKDKLKGWKFVADDLVRVKANQTNPCAQSLEIGKSYLLYADATDHLKRLIKKGYNRTQQVEVSVDTGEGWVVTSSTSSSSTSSSSTSSACSATATVTAPDSSGTKTTTTVSVSSRKLLAVASAHAVAPSKGGNSAAVFCSPGNGKDKVVKKEIDPVCNRRAHLSISNALCYGTIEQPTKAEREAARKSCRRKAP
jgi:hypothetical protein